MINSLIRSIFGTKHDREMKSLRPLVDRINALEKEIEGLSDRDLQAKTEEFRRRYRDEGASLDQLLPEAFAVCREASRRALGMRHYDVQLIGGIILHRGQIAEMRTGEGKTLVATLPVYLNSLSGKGVHVVTVNDYLARRDSEWMGQIYKFLGLSVGVIVHDLSDQERKEAYGADITYATNNELGFDYLRDNMKFDLENYVQRELNYAIVDECDSILIDEARTPLIISGPAEASTDKYQTIDRIIPHLERDIHFTMEEKSKTASLTDEGNSKVESLLKVDNLYDPAHIELLHHIYQGLKAHYLYKRDVDYMIKDGEVMIVDEFTGRLMPGRRWSDGLHQAIEAKEKVKVKNENQTLATITFQNYFRMYKKLAGMTGTADTEAVEFKKIYNLEVSVIPTNKPICRIDHNDIVYKTEEAKWRAIAQDIRERHEKGQPILVGTVSIEKSELLSQYLRDQGIAHHVLNAKYHEQEAEIIAQAGRKGAVTIATNMAGRGTDIILGGNPEVMAKRAMVQILREEFPEPQDEDMEEEESGEEQEGGVEENGSGDRSGDLNQEREARIQARHKEVYEEFRILCEREKVDVIGAGGLYIIGTERHESRRIDNQLRGRSGRQGDPGASRFYLSLEDNLMRIFNGEMIQRIMNRLNVPDDEPIEARMVTRSIEGAQRKVEGHHFDIRKHLLDYDNVMNQQRTIIYGMRRQILEGRDLERTVLNMLSDVTSSILDQFIPVGSKRESWNLEGLNNALQEQFGLRMDWEQFSHLDEEVLTESIGSTVKSLFEKQRDGFGSFYSQLLKMLLLQAIDLRWKEHLLRIDRIKEGINLRGYAQRDPIIEYKKEAFKTFEMLNKMIQSDTIEKLLKIQVVSQEQADELNHQLLETDRNIDELDYQGAEEGGGSSYQLQDSSSPASAEGPRSSPSGDVPRGGGRPGSGRGSPPLNRSQRRHLERRRR